MRCHGSKRYAIRCNNQARAGFATCHVHEYQEASVQAAFADEIAAELTLIPRVPQEVAATASPGGVSEDGTQHPSAGGP